MKETAKVVKNRLIYAKMCEMELNGAKLCWDLCFTMAIDLNETHRYLRAHPNSVAQPHENERRHVVERPKNRVSLHGVRDM